MSGAESPPVQVLTGGHVSGEVVRIGDTVRKPATRATPAVHAFMAHLAQRVPEVGAPLGTEGPGTNAGRQVLTWAPGRTQHEIGLLAPDELHRVGDLVARLHRAAADFVPAPEAAWEVAIRPDGENLCVHHDLAPWNLVVDGNRWRVIDFDGAGPGTALWDLAYAVHGFVGIQPDADPGEIAVRIAAIVDGYGLARADRQRLVPMLARRTAAMRDLLRSAGRDQISPWAELHRAGHTRHWTSATSYLERHQTRWAAALGVR